MKFRPAAEPGTMTVKLRRSDEQLPEMGGARAPLLILKVVVPIHFSPFSYKSPDYAAAFAAQKEQS